MNAVSNERNRTALSLYAQATCEAERHKWIESQKCGFDRGDDAKLEWVSRYWQDYCRRKRLQHLRAECYFEEFGRDSFGRLVPLLLRDNPLIVRVIDMVESGMENLDIFCWAHEFEVDLVTVHEVLSIIDVNDGRLDPGLF